MEFTTNAKRYPKHAPMYNVGANKPPNPPEYKINGTKRNINAN